MKNGRLALSTLTQIGPGQHLRADAAVAFLRLSAAFLAHFGKALGVTDAYRDYDEQVAVKKVKKSFAATPGYSLHGWGIALDLGSRVNIATSAEHRWMQANAARFGWVNPAWAQTSKLEPWHWEFVPHLIEMDNDMTPDQDAMLRETLDRLRTLPNDLWMGPVTGTDPVTGESQTHHAGAWLTVIAFRVRDLLLGAK